MENKKKAIFFRRLCSLGLFRGTFGGSANRRRKNRVFTLFLCFGIQLLVIIFPINTAHAPTGQHDATSAAVQSRDQSLGPGLYKDGQKVLSFEEMVPAQMASPVETPGSRFLAKAFGGRSPNEPSAKRVYLNTVIECRNVIQSLVSESNAATLSEPEVDRLLALEGSLHQAHESLLQELDRVGTTLEGSEQAPEKLERYTAVRERYRVHGERLFDLLARLGEARSTGNEGGMRNVLVELNRFLREAEFKNPVPPPLSPQPSIVPVVPEEPVLKIEDKTSPAPKVPYPVRSASGYDPADLAETIDVQFTDEIVARAAELNHSPAEIYEYVRNNLAFECYLGSRKGSGQTLEHMGGNDYDQASLLIALLRVSGIPARYASGRVKMPSERATNWLGFEDAYSAALMLNSSGFQVTIYGSPGNITAVACNRVWVEAWVPYINYRGAVNDSTGFMWVPLDPSFKQYEYEPSINLFGEIDFDAEAFVEDYYSTVRTETPIEMFKQLMIDSLAYYHPGAAYEDMIRRRSVIEETDGIIPGTLPYELLSFSGTFPEIPANMRYRVGFHVYGSGTDLNYTTSLPELASKQVTLSYVGATAWDQAQIDAAGGIWFLPDPSMVDLVPVLKIDGCEVSRGTGGVMTGTYHYSNMQFTPPTGAPIQGTLVQNYIIAGNYQGLGIDTEDALPSFFSIVETACSEEYMGEVVHQTALKYLNNVDVGDDELMAMMHGVLTNDVSEAIVENTITVWVDYWGDPVDLEWTGMLVDADRKIVGPYSVHGDDILCDFMRVGGADGSFQENRVFETVFEEEAISTIKILALANDLGIPVCKITSGLGDCPGINQYSAVINYINAAIAAGHHIIIPRQPLTYFDWTGTAWIDIDPTTCAAGYIIYGGHDWASSAGGATVQEWTVSYEGLQCLNPSGTITVDPPGDFYCDSDPRSWTFTVNGLKYIGKNASGTPCQQLYSVNKEFKVTNYTIQALADNPRFGPGEYVFRVGGPTVCAGCTPKEKTVTILKTELHPAASDFEAGKAGGILITTLQDDHYYTSVKTTKANTVAQTQDHKVKITAHLTPAALAVGRTVYFRVVDPDPDDVSSYEIGATRGDNYATTDKPGKLNAASNVAQLKTINDVEVAAAEVELTITDRFSGDNYQVECSLDVNFSTICDKTVLLVAWKRIYVEYDKMYKTGSHLSADLAGDGNADPDVVAVHDASVFAVNDNVIIFDAANPGGETAKITAIAANSLTLDKDLAKSYNAGYDTADKGAAVAVPGDGTYTTNLALLRDAYGDDMSGTDGGCFVEIKDLGAGNNVPCWNELVNTGVGDESDNLVKFTNVWFRNSAGAGSNYLHLVAANYYEKGDHTFGISWALDTENWIYVFCGEMHDQGYANEVAALGETTVHELGHHFSLRRGDNGSGHVDNDIAYDNHEASDDCVMSYHRDRDDGEAEFCYDGASDCIDDIRRLLDGI